MKSNFSVCLFLVFAASFAKAQAPSVHLLFSATLSGDEVVPAVSTNGTGMVTLLFNGDRTKINVSGLIVGLSGSVTAAYLNNGMKGETGDTLIHMLPVVTGRRVAGELDAPAGLLSQLLLDRVYVNIQTSAHPAGEIRGQFAGESDINLRIEMTGAQAVPANNSTGIGVGGLHFPTGSHEVDYAILVQGLSGPVTGAAIYEGEPGENGTLVVDMPGLVGGEILLGLIEDGVVIADFIQKCIEGKYYAVVKTAAYPDGELRGQFSFLGYLNAFAPVNSVQPVPPPGPTAGFGMSYTYPNTTLDSLHTTVLISNVIPSWASIRIAPAGANGPVLHDLEPGGVPGLYRKTFPLDDVVLTDFVSNRLYIAFGNDAHPNGEIRGQMKNCLRKCYAFDLCGSQEVPPNTSTALGMAMTSVDQNDCYINYKIIVDGLGSVPSEAHISEGVPGVTGSILYNMAVTQPFIAGFHAISAAHGPLIESEGTYMSIHTDAYPNGEIRGQIRRGLSCPLVTAVEEIGIRNFQVFPNPVEAVLYIQWENESTFSGQLQLRDISGKMLLEKTVEVGSGAQTLELPVGGSVLPGIYHLSLSDDGLNRGIGKVIVVH